MCEPYARCKACDSSFYPAWLSEHNCFEELCYTCKQIALGNDTADSELDAIRRELAENYLPDLQVLSEYDNLGDSYD